MGVKDLLTWVKKAYPQAIKSYPKRWESPELKGKRVAIDATLLTNRYHFASRNGPWAGKGEIIGWYNLITEMRASGVKPVAIWDQRGYREWKAPEAHRRLMTRATHLARKEHEITRSSRLSSLREVLYDFEEMPEEEKEVVRAHWETTRFMFVQPKAEVAQQLREEGEAEEGKGLTTEGKGTVSRESLITPPTPSSTPPADVSKPIPTLSQSDGESIDRITGMIDSLAHLVQDYRDHYQAPASTTPRIDGLGLDLNLEHMEEEIQQWASLRPPASESSSAKEEEEKARHHGVEELDETLQEMLEGKVKETKRQAELTREEGEIINLALSPTTSSAAYPTPPPTPPSSPSPFPQLSAPHSPITRLDHLIDALPVVKEVYERALDVPSIADHEDCKTLLGVMGVPVIEAMIPYEAEGFAASLAKKGLVDFVGTEDSDVLAYEGPLLRNLSPLSSPLSYVSGSHLRQLTSLTPPQYLDFLILLGTDASPRIPKVGPMTAFKLIRQHSSIEFILEHEPTIAKRLDDRGKFMVMVNNARRVFNELPEVEGVVEEGMLEEGAWDEGKIETFLEEEHGIKLVEAGEQVENGTEQSSGSEDKSVDFVAEALANEQRRG
ncbi:hypothetical protein CI109_107078 [Kwoniella shandongensis]|uniref:Exonuclease 1 n=1 Tax=Kwoniella shandongensis TaxID=1734106 RepID=A0A5M6BR33_9TREE|nr:uncharacterized protein CI109_006486 [Kwoniella shandongensis]KAA5525217.1 hypothetical protein CI109_006486 [Kwoniella shandongensis]